MCSARRKLWFDRKLPSGVSRTRTSNPRHNAILLSNAGIQISYVITPAHRVVVRSADF